MRRTKGRFGGKVYDDRGSRTLLDALLGRGAGRAGTLPTRRVDPAVASRLAGARGRSAPGVDYVDRLSHYQEQNGPPYKLTDRQHRRVAHKLHHQEAQARRAIDQRAWLDKTRSRLATAGGALDG